ncbi:putative xylogalacturonan beta-1,3-xylosyltransferase [Helianthus annuus]|nr:putative xylogalacturonan beta-1,3-xylosyltransferase [Helianthus annuus]
METKRPLQRLCKVQILRLLVLIISLVVVIILIIISQLITFPYTLSVPPVTKGIFVNEAAVYNNSNESGPVFRTLSGAGAHKIEVVHVNGSNEEEGCKGYGCNNGSLLSQSEMKQNDSGQSGQTVVVALEPTRLSYMVSVLESTVAARFSKNKALPARDRELKHARMKIENEPMLGSTEGLHPSLYHNLSRFLRSYELMEKTLKVYIYKEGKKPIFHDPKLRGIYASEGWFMKLMEKNRNYVVKDPRKAHLFYLPFSSLKLRNTSQERTPTSRKDLEQHLKDYASLIARKYPFWNRTNGADHFLVACHDWAMELTKDHMGNCIRSLCNSNLGRGFKIGKDTTLPATYIRSAENPVQDLGGNPRSERPILAFFAGGMHGNLRPILLQTWQDNKDPDIKILGPMARDIESKAKYRMYMKSSKYCICARGHEVYSPRIVESIYYECVPVIISDNYVPPFFEVLNWGAFSVFVLEKDVVNLGGILRAIPEKKYIEMQKRVKMVQQHFIWHKMPVKFDLFHMILHSVWNSRVVFM